MNKYSTINRDNGSSKERRLVDYTKGTDYESDTASGHESSEDSQDIKKLLVELEGDNADIKDIESFEDLMKHPKEGSLIMAFRDPQRRTKQHAMKVATDSIMPNIVPILFSDEVPMEIYVLMRLLLPHKKAVAVAEKIGDIAKKNNTTTTSVLAEISGLDIKNRSDIKKVITRLLNYHPHIGQMIKNFSTKFVF